MLVIIRIANPVSQTIQSSVLNRYSVCVGIIQPVYITYKYTQLNSAEPQPVAHLTPHAVWKAGSIAESVGWNRKGVSPTENPCNQQQLALADCRTQWILWWVKQ